MWLDSTRLETPVTRDLTRLEHWSQWLVTRLGLDPHDSWLDSGLVPSDSSTALGIPYRRRFDKPWTMLNSSRKCWKHSTFKSNTNTSGDSYRKSVSHQLINIHSGYICGWTGHAGVFPFAKAGFCETRGNWMDFILGKRLKLYIDERMVEMDVFKIYCDDATWYHLGHTSRPSPLPGAMA